MQLQAEPVNVDWLLQKRVEQLWDRLLRWQRSLCWRRTTTKDDVPPVMREFNIDSGYRLAGCSWSYYLHSGFKMHNETINWLSHSLGAMLMLATLMSCSAQLPDASREDLGIMWLFGGCSVLLHAASGVAHLLHNRSELAHCFVFFIDNAAAGLCGYGCNLANLAFLSSGRFYDLVAGATLPILVFGAICMSAAYSLALARFRRSYSAATAALMFGPSGLFVLFGFGPWLHRVADAALWGGGGDLRPFLHLLPFAAGVACYAAYFPERLRPGHFDIVGHSHQWFHLLITMSHYLLVTSIFQEIRDDSPRLFSKRPAGGLSLEAAFCGLGVVAVFDAALIVLYLKTFRYDSEFKSKAA